MLIKTYRMEDDWLHPDEVVTYQRNKGLSADLLNRPVGTTLDEINDFASFTTDADDHLLVIYGAVASQSGHKMASDLSSATTAPDLTAGKQLHISGHSCILGDNTNNLANDAGANTGFEQRCMVAYIDRENELTRVCSSQQDGSSPYSGDTFGGIVSASTLTGTDAALGSFTVSLNLRGFEEIGSCRIIKWTAGNAPAIAVIETAMEWMWYEWATKNNPILYPPLSNYTN